MLECSFILCTHILTVKLCVNNIATFLPITELLKSKPVIFSVRHLNFMSEVLQPWTTSCKFTRIVEYIFIGV
jgi:hypothetical protein